MNSQKEKLNELHSKLSVRFERFNVLAHALEDLADQNREFYGNMGIDYGLADNLQSAAAFMLRELREAEFEADAEFNEMLAGGVANE